MKKRILLLLLSFSLLLPVTVHAATPKVIDDADLLTNQETDLLESSAQSLADTYQMDVVILTVDSLGGKTSEAYADDYFDYNGYGIGDDFSGILLLVSMEQRDWSISTCGEAIYAVTDYGIESLAEVFLPYLSNGRYYDAFRIYLQELETYFKAYRSGDPIDGYIGSYDGQGTYQPGTQDEIVYYEEPFGFSDVMVRLLVALVIGAVIAGIVLLVMRGRMNTAKQQSGAKNYMVSGSYNLYRCQDFYLYSRTSRTRKQENNSSGGHGGGGGSSVHHSSSGRSHGGGHGKF